MKEMGSEEVESATTAGQEDDSAEAIEAAKRAELEKEMHVYESYIVGMLEISILCHLIESTTC